MLTLEILGNDYEDNDNFRCLVKSSAGEAKVRLGTAPTGCPEQRQFIAKPNIGCRPISNSRSICLILLQSPLLTCI